MKFSSLHSALLAAFSLAWGEASAFGLGEIHSASRIGERLYAEIDLSVQPDERLDAGCVRLDKSQVGDGIPSLQLGSLSVRRGNSPVLVVRSAGFIQEPVLRLGLNVGCGFEIRREYTLLLLPPQVDEEAPRVVPPIFRRETLPVVERSFPRQRVTQAVPRSLSTDEELPAFPVRQKAEVKKAEVKKTEAQALEKSVDKAAPVKETKAERKVAPRVLRDRLFLTAPGEVGEPALRLSSDLLSWRGENPAQEAQRDLLRLEFRMLQALHEQALAQLEAAEKLRQMEGTLGELQQRTGEFNRRLEQKTEVAALSAVATPEPALPLPAAVAAKPVVKEPAAERQLTPWSFYAALLALVLLVGGWLALRHRRQSTRQIVDDNLTLIPEQYIDPRRDSEIEDFEALDSPQKPSRGKPIEPSLETLPVLTTTVPAATTAQAPTWSQASVAAATLDEHFEMNPVMELADIMLSFGRVKGAAQALQEYIDHSPEEALQPWIRLMDVYRMAGMRSEFERVAAELNQHFNVEIQRWDSSAAGDKNPAAEHAPAEPLPIEWETTARQTRSIEDLEHIADRVVSLWPGSECLEYLNQLLRDNRGGQRSGFSLPVVDEMMFLVELLTTLAKIEAEAAGK